LKLVIDALQLTSIQSAAYRFDQRQFHGAQTLQLHKQVQDSD